MPPVLAARGVSKSYPGVVAVHEADLAVNPGEILGLVGKNGAGKSTLIAILSGAIRPDRGQILADGEPVQLHGPRDGKAIGVVALPQEMMDLAALSVSENVHVGLPFPHRRGTRTVDWGTLHRDTGAVLERLGLDLDPRAPVRSLSIAHQRMVMIARALAAEARVLILDEPSASLSDVEIAHLHAVVRKLRDEGVALVYVSHRLPEVIDLTDRVVVMRDARVVAEHVTAELDHDRLVAMISGEQEPRTSTSRAPSPPSAVPAREELLRVDGLTVDGRLHDVSLQLAEGEVLGIGGLVGAGRTELVRAICGADRRSAGTIAVRGVETKITSPAHAIAAGIVLLPEDRRNQGVLLGMSIRQNVTVSSLSRFRRQSWLPSPSPGKERTAGTEMVRRLGIRTPNDKQTVGALSGGNQQKVAFGKWLQRGADVFILDEPTHGIDIDGKRDVYALVAELAAAGKGVIFISSELAELEQVCDRVVVLSEGRVVGELEGEKISEQAIVERCYHHDTKEEAA